MLNQGTIFLPHSEKRNDISSLTDTKALSASDDAIHQSRVEEVHGGSNPDIMKHNLRPLTRQLSSSVPDLSEKPDKK